MAEDPVSPETIDKRANRSMWEVTGITTAVLVLVAIIIWAAMHI